MTARKYRGAWWVDFWWTHVREPRAGQRERIRKKSPIDNKRGAEEYERQIRARLLEGKLLDGTDPRVPVIPLFRDFADEFMTTYAITNNKPSEQDTKRSMLRHHLLPRFGEMKLDAIGKHDIEKKRADMKAAGLSAKRINNVTGCLLKILRYAQELEVIEKVPRVRPLRTLMPKIDFFTFDEYARLVDAAKDDAQLLAMIRVGAEAGLRKGEIAALEPGDVDFKTRRLTVRRNVWFRSNEEHVTSPKGGRERTIDMSANLTAGLQAVRSLRPRFFYSRTGNVQTPKVMEAALKSACRRAGLRPVGWHCLRHTFCSHLVMSGADAKTVQEYAGHTTLAMTLRYMHLSPAHKREAIDRLDRVRSEQQAGHHLGTSSASNA